MSISSTDSCGRPLRNDADSMPSPVTAPPRVIVLSCGTTSGAQPVGERGGDQVLVRAHAGDVGGAGVGVDRDDARQPRGVQALGGVLGPRPEQVRGGFGQPDSGVRRDGSVTGEKPLARPRREQLVRQLHTTDTHIR